MDLEILERLKDVNGIILEMSKPNVCYPYDLFMQYKQERAELLKKLKASLNV